MEFVPIFETNYPREDCLLWAVQYDGEVHNEIDKLFDEWDNLINLRTFFKEKEEYLKTDFWGGMTVKQAFMKTVKETNELWNNLFEAEQNGQCGNIDTLYEIFTRLSKNEYKISGFYKGKPLSSKPFLRLYAVQLEEGQLVITGGGIKLTDTIQGSPWLENELTKLETVKTFLKSEGIAFLE